MADLTHAAAIVGIHEHVTRYAPDKSELQIQGESVIKALDDAGLSKQDVDGLLTASSSMRNSGLNLADYLNMYPKFVDNTTVGGGSFEFHLSHALNAIVAGRINCAVITYSSLARSASVSVGTGGVARFGHPTLEPSPDSFEELYGLTTVGLYAMIAQRHMHLYGTTSEQLAEIAVAIRHHASMNPEALFRNPITVEEVVNSRMISSPLHLPDCCVITDGGGAVVVASAEVARNCRRAPVWVLGTGEAVAHQGAGKRDLLYIAAQQSHKPAFAMAGVTHEDIDMAMIYDSFTITVLETLEDLGLLDKPRLLVMNKMDLLPEKTDVEDSAVLLGPDQPGSDRLGSDRLPNVLISAAKRWNFDNLLEKIESQLIDLDGPLTVGQPATGRSRLLNR